MSPWDQEMQNTFKKIDEDISGGNIYLFRRKLTELLSGCKKMKIQTDILACRDL